VAGHGHDAGGDALGLEGLARGDRELDLGAGADEHDLRSAVAGLEQHVGAAGDAVRGREAVLAARERRDVLPGEDEADGIPTRVVSMPSQEWFAQQDDEYRESVLPSGVRARVSVEAGIAMSWHRIVGDAGRTVSLEHYGASAAAETLFEEFGFTPEAVVAAARESIAAAQGDAPSPTTPSAPTESKAGDQL